MQTIGTRLGLVPVQVITHAQRRMKLFDSEEGGDGDEYGGSLSVLWLEDGVQVARLSKRGGSTRVPFMKTYWMGYACCTTSKRVCHRMMPVDSGGVRLGCITGGHCGDVG